MASDGMDYTRPTRSEKNQSAALEGVNGAVGIRNGVQCANFVVDQNTVIFLLNRIPTTSGGALSPTGQTLFKAPRSGFCDPALSEAIRRFQQANGLKADGVVDPGGPTSRKMRALSTAVNPATDDGSREERLINDIQKLDGLLQITADKMSGSAEGAQFRAIASELQQLLARAGITPAVQVRFGVAGATLFDNLFEIEILANTVTSDVLGVLATLTVEKARKGLPDLGGILFSAQHARDLAARVRGATAGTLVQALGRLAKVAGSIQGSCSPLVQVLLVRTSFLVALLSKPATAAGRVTPDTVGVGRAWLAAFSDAVLCLDDKAIPLLGAAQGALEGGRTLIGLLQTFLGAGDLPRLSRA